ncbi:Hypothetical protein PBC10988_21440 [Planctomycetales bacterium 10988]|nr:Hypothetical protein PBC10988_21440 [Planctomycetales bacterium 10988]
MLDSAEWTLNGETLGAWMTIVYSVMMLMGLTFFVKKQVPREPFKPVFWGPIFFFFWLVMGNLLLVLGFSLVLYLLATVTIYPDLAANFGKETSEGLDPQTMQIMFISSALAMGFSLMAANLWLLYSAEKRIDYQTKREIFEQLGWKWNRRLQDVGLGMAVAIAAIPGVMGLQWLLTQLVGEDATPHAVEQFLTRYPSGFNFIICGLAVVVAAPIWEEFLFRRVLQGWLITRLGTWSKKDGTLPVLGTILPISIGAVIFAALHFEQWPAPMTLFLFAVILGYLYHYTQSLVPCIVVHACLNGTSLAGIFFFQNETPETVGKIIDLSTIQVFIMEALRFLA